MPSYKGISSIASALGGKIIAKPKSASNDSEKMMQKAESSEKKEEEKTWSDIWRDFPRRFKRKPRVQKWQRIGAEEIGAKVDEGVGSIDGSGIVEGES